MDANAEPPLERPTRRKGQPLWLNVIWVLLLLVAVGLVGLAVRSGAPAASSARPTPAPTPTLAPPRQTPAQAGWTATTGAHTLIHALARAPWGILYAGASGAVYASTDNGATWHVLGQGFPKDEAWGVTALQGPRGDAVLAACGDGFVYRLPRGGTHWLRSGAPIGTQAASLLVLPHSGVVLAGSDRGIFRSTDGGRSWTLVAATGAGAVATFVRDPAGGTIYAGLAGVPRPLLVSTDRGLTWHAPAAPVPPPSVEALLAAAGHIYAGVMRSPGGQAVWVGGAHGFSVIAGGLPPISHGMALATTGGPQGRLLVGTMGVGVYVKAGHGAWTRLGQGPADGLILSLLVLPGRQPVVLAGTDNGVYRLRLP